MILVLKKPSTEKLKQFLSTMVWSTAEIKVFWFQKAYDTKNLLSWLVTETNDTWLLGIGLRSKHVEQFSS